MKLAKLTGAIRIQARRVAGSEGRSDLIKKSNSSYILTDAAVFATATVTVLRVQPYSIE